MTTKYFVIKNNTTYEKNMQHYLELFFVVPNNEAMHTILYVGDEEAQALTNLIELLRDNVDIENKLYVCSDRTRGNLVPIYEIVLNTIRHLPFKINREQYVILTKSLTMRGLTPAEPYLCIGSPIQKLNPSAKKRAVEDFRNTSPINLYTSDEQVINYISDNNNLFNELGKRVD